MEPQRGGDGSARQPVLLDDVGHDHLESAASGPAVERLSSTLRRCVTPGTPLPHVPRNRRSGPLVRRLPPKRILDRTFDRLIRANQPRVLAQRLVDRTDGNAVDRCRECGILPTCPAVITPLGLGPRSTPTLSSMSVLHQRRPGRAGEPRVRPIAWRRRRAGEASSPHFAFQSGGAEP